MKKAYICPKTETTVLHTEAMLAASFNINQGEAEQWTEKKDWESPSWGTGEDDVEE